MSRRAPGQAAVELLAMIPVLVLVGLLAWQLTAVLAAGLEAQEDVRARAMGAAGASGRIAVVTATVSVPGLLPGMRGLRVPARAAVRTP